MENNHISTSNAIEHIVELETERLKPFPDHPFKVCADIQMKQLKESIQKYGILTPLLVRPNIDGSYEIISGHRRKYAAIQLGYRKVPVIIRVLDNDEAVISMVDSNLQRERLIPSEKAFAYKMKYDVIKKKAGRKKGGQLVPNTGLRSTEILGTESGDSAKQVQRYLRLTHLIPELLEKVDAGSMGFTPAVQLSYLPENEQRGLLEAMDYSQSTPSLSQAHRLRKLSHEGKLTQNTLNEVLSEIKQKDIERVIFKNEQLYQFFPATYSAARMKRTILEILKAWTEVHWAT